jgi:hypothetical protein
MGIGLGTWPGHFPTGVPDSILGYPYRRHDHSGERRRRLEPHEDEEQGREHAGP